MNYTNVLSSYAVTTSYEFRMELTDKFNTSVTEINLGTGQVVMSWGKTGVGIGKIWQQGALDIEGDVHVNGNININSKNILNLCQGRDKNHFRFYVDGNANTFYPVMLSSAARHGYNKYSITRTYNWDAPNTWNNASHKGGLTFTFEWSGDTAWGGNHKALRVTEFNETYSRVLGGMTLTVNGLLVWLRGGTALYEYQSEIGYAATATVYYSTYTASDGRTYSPRTATEADSAMINEVYAKYPIRSESQLYDINRRVMTVAGGTFTNNILVPNATDYTTSRVRNARFGTTIPTSLANGEIYFMYE